MPITDAQVRAAGTPDRPWPPKGQRNEPHLHLPEPRHAGSALAWVSGRGISGWLGSPA
jgi:hypothetical protein